VTRGVKGEPPDIALVDSIALPVLGLALPVPGRGPVPVEPFILTTPIRRSYALEVPSWGQKYLGLEQASSVIRTYQPQLVPDLLQTEDVTRDVMRVLHPRASALDLERRVALQMTRQETLTRPGAPHVWAVLDHAALWRLVSSSALHAQTRHSARLGAAAVPNHSALLHNPAPT
jgi:hypothetical protein